MKSTAILLSILIIILVLNGIINGMLEESANEMLEELKVTVELMNAGDAVALLEQVNAMQQQWDKKESLWEAFVDHEDTERVSIALTRLNAMAEGGTLDIMPAEIQELAFLMGHIVEKHQLRLENIM